MGKDVDLNAVGARNGNLWGLPHTPEEAALVIIPMPWEVTVSFKGGTRLGPDAILAASPQIDLFDHEHWRYPTPWHEGIALSRLDAPQLESSAHGHLRALAQNRIKQLERGEQDGGASLSQLAEINEACADLARRLKHKAADLLSKGKLVAVLGGDHSTPLGLMTALSERYPEMGMLHIDAHFDLREAYEGFEYSHASVMYNASHYGRDLFQRFVHVGIRDFCEAEHRHVRRLCGLHRVFSDRELQRKRFEGVPWALTCDRIIANLPDEVYVSFDIDGLDPSLCPNTGTPVPGGLSFEEAMYLLEKVVESSRRIVGFDLVEVAPASVISDTWAGDWNANVGMRALYRLSCLALQSQKDK